MLFKKKIKSPVEASETLKDIIDNKIDTDYAIESLSRDINDIKLSISPEKLEGVVLVCIKKLLQCHNLTVVAKCQEKEYYSELIANEVKELEQKERELKEALESVDKALRKVKK